MRHLRTSSQLGVTSLPTRNVRQSIVDLLRGLLLTKGPNLQGGDATIAPGVRL